MPDTAGWAGGSRRHFQAGRGEETSADNYLGFNSDEPTKVDMREGKTSWAGGYSSARGNLGKSTGMGKFGSSAEMRRSPIRTNYNL